MKTRAFCILTFFISIIACTSSHDVVISNPVDVAMGDPFVMLASDGHYYMFGTTSSTGFKAYRSDDLSQWDDLGLVYDGKQSGSWTVDCYWAPEVFEYQGKFYMFFSANWKENPTDEEENFRIGVAVSDSPAGPYVEMYDRPIFDPGYPIIDADVLFEEDGRCYLYYSRCCYKHPVESEIAKIAREEGKYEEIEESWVYGVEMKPDFSGVIGEPVVLLQPPYSIDDLQSEWESRSVAAGEANRRWTEGSLILKKDGIYYMMYSSNYYQGENYAIGYATASSPLGPFSKSSDNPVLQKNTAEGGNVTGVGHNSVTYSRDGKHMYCVYHGRTQATGNDRVVFVDEMEIKDGKLTVFGPTTAPKHKPLPLADPYILCDGDTYYLYGTGANNGIAVYTSKDLESWESPSGEDFYLALRRGDSWGRRWFWAPEVYKVDDNKYIMYYSAEEHICAAVSDSPVGPFKQSELKPMRPDEKGIDNSMFIDDDGKAYIFWCRFIDGNQIWMAELEDDLVTIRPGTERFCIKMSQEWETDMPSVNEGAFVIKHKGIYYLTYSANDYRSQKYGIGYATTDDLSKPWTKYEGNPVLQSPGDLVGVGHHTLFTDRKGHRRIVYHSHYSKDSVQPRLIQISSYLFRKSMNGPDILQVSDKYITPYYVSE